MKQLFIFFALVSGLLASEIIIDGAYSGLLGNPFQAKLGVKTKDITILSDNKMIPIEVITNRTDFSSLYRKPEFTVNSGSCKNVLKTFFAETYQVVDNSKNSAYCEIEKVKVNISYVFEREQWMEQISNIEVETTIKINLTLDEVSKTLLLSDKMDKTLGKTGQNYDFTIRAVWKPDNKNVEKNIQMIFENLLFNQLNLNIKG